MGQSLSHSFSTVSESDTQKVVRLRITYTSTDGVSDTSNDFDVTGDFPNKSNQSVSISIPYGGGSQVIYDENLTITKQYGTTVTKSFSASLSGINYWGGTITKSGSTTASARPYNTPSAPTAVSVSRTNDTKHVVSWTRNASSSAPYTSQNVQRRTYTNGSWGSWYTIGTVGTDYTGSGSNSYTDSNTVANRAYQYRVQAVNSSGSATSSASGISYTSPATPASVVATKSGTDIKVTITPGQAVSAVDFEIQESTNNGSTWGSTLGTINGGNSGTFTYTHVSPSTSVTHRYRARAVIDSASAESGDNLPSGWKESATVQLAAPPSSPTNLSPNGAAKQATNAIPLTWLHNPTDSSEQRKFQVRHRAVGGSWTEASVVTSANKTWTLPANTYANGVIVEWAVRTWGVATTGGSDGTGASNYSATATITLSAPPTASINAPADAEVLATSVLELDWGFFDPEDAAQAAWEIELLDSEGKTLEAKSGVGTDHIVAFDTAAEDGGAYTMRVRVQDSTGFWSNWDQVNVTVSFLPPALVNVDATYYPDSGSVVLTLQPEAAVPGVTEEATTVAVQRSIDGGPWITVFEDVPADSALVDTSPTIHGVNCYRVIVYSALPSSRMQSTSDVATNLLANSSFEKFVGTSEMVRNYALDPASTAMTRFSVIGISGAAVVSITDLPGWDNAIQWTQDATSDRVVTDNSGAPLGLTYGAAWVKAPAGASMYLAILNGGGSVPTTRTNKTFTGTGEWQFISGASAVTTSGGARLEVRYVTGGTGNGVVLATGWTITTKEIPYAFSGSYSPDTDLTPAWTGTANDSASTLTATMAYRQEPSPGGTITGAYRSSQWANSGSYSLKKPAGGHGNIDSDLTNARSAWIGRALTVKAKYRLDQDYTAAFKPRLGFRNYGSATTEVYMELPTTAGEHEVSQTFVIPSDGTGPALRWWKNDDAVANMWLDDLILVEGEYDGPIFDPDLGVAETPSTCRGVPPEAPLTVVENADGTSTLQTCFVAVVTDDDSNGFLNVGTGFEEVAVLVCDMQFSTVTGRKKELHHFAGRERPLEFSSSSVNHTLTVNGTVTGIFTSVEEVEKFARTGGIVLWRDYTGRRMFGSLGDVSASMKDQTTPDVWDISFPITEVDYAG